MDNNKMSLYCDEELIDFLLKEKIEHNIKNDFFITPVELTNKNTKHTLGTFEKILTSNTTHNRDTNQLKNKKKKKNTVEIIDTEFLTDLNNIFEAVPTKIINKSIKSNSKKIKVDAQVNKKSQNSIDKKSQVTYKEPPLEQDTPPKFHFTETEVRQKLEQEFESLSDFEKKEELKNVKKDSTRTNSKFDKKTTTSKRKNKKEKIEPPSNEKNQTVLTNDLKNLQISKFGKKTKQTPVNELITRESSNSNNLEGTRNKKDKTRKTNEEPIIESQQNISNNDSSEKENVKKEAKSSKKSRKERKAKTKNRIESPFLSTKHSEVLLNEMGEPVLELGGGTKSSKSNVDIDSGMKKDKANSPEPSIQNKERKPKNKKSKKPKESTKLNKQTDDVIEIQKTENNTGSKELEKESKNLNVVSNFEEAIGSSKKKRGKKKKESANKQKIDDIKNDQEAPQTGDNVEKTSSRKRRDKKRRPTNNEKQEDK